MVFRFPTSFCELHLYVPVNDLPVLGMMQVQPPFGTEGSIDVTFWLTIPVKRGEEVPQPTERM